MRIITGRARGMNLFTPKNYDVRPTADRVKESVFNILSSVVIDARVLDAFAGTGNLGLECWSRGAASIFFVDKSKESLKIVQRNIEKCRADDECTVLQGDAISIMERLSRQQEQFDLVFLDPPYGKGLVEKALYGLANNNLLANGALVVAERASNEQDFELPEGFMWKRREKYGSTIIDFIGSL